MFFNFLGKNIFKFLSLGVVWIGVVLAAFSLGPRGFSFLNLLLLLILTISGMLISYLIFRFSLDKSEHIRALQSHLILSIANETLPYLRKGLSFDSAFNVAQIIREKMKVFALAITDSERVLAFVGTGEDHHMANGPILTKATREALSRNEVRVLSSKEEIGCPTKECPLKAAIVVPLEVKGKPVGTLKFYYKDESKLSESNLAMAKGLAKLLSTQLELSEVERMESLTCEAELKALQAQIHPHFLFNSLNTIAMFCRVNPEEARRLLIQFAEFFRKSLEWRGELVDLKEELDYVNSYLALEKARFGAKLEVIEEIDPIALKCKLPTLTIQPIVENSIQHGMPPEGHIQIKISAQVSNSIMQVLIEDNGIGIHKRNLKKVLSKGFGRGIGIGLSNVNERLVSLFGEDYHLVVSSSQGEGTQVKIKIPILGGAGETSSTYRRRRSTSQV
ncbi:MAG: histidine kinase [Candidatus Subteraquimicrobiales bacterium]|nr:histidine kinase [Candidatus Subteraquimicrobiales bacterium]